MLQTLIVVAIVATGCACYAGVDAHALGAAPERRDWRC